MVSKSNLKWPSLFQPIAMILYTINSLLCTINEQNGEGNRGSTILWYILMSILISIGATAFTISYRYLPKYFLDSPQAAQEQHLHPHQINRFQPQTSSSNNIHNLNPKHKHSNTSHSSTSVKNNSLSNNYPNHNNNVKIESNMHDNVNQNNNNNIRDSSQNNNNNNNNVKQKEGRVKVKAKVTNNSCILAILENVLIVLYALYFMIVVWILLISGNKESDQEGGNHKDAVSSNFIALLLQSISIAQSILKNQVKWTHKISLQQWKLTMAIVLFAVVLVSVAISLSETTPSMLHWQYLVTSIAGLLFFPILQQSSMHPISHSQEESIEAQSISSPNVAAPAGDATSTAVKQCKSVKNRSNFNGGTASMPIVAGISRQAGSTALTSNLLHSQKKSTGRFRDILDTNAISERIAMCSEDENIENTNININMNNKNSFILNQHSSNQLPHIISNNKTHSDIFLPEQQPTSRSLFESKDRSNHQQQQHQQQSEEGRNSPPGKLSQILQEHEISKSNNTFQQQQQQNQFLQSNLNFRTLQEPPNLREFDSKQVSGYFGKDSLNQLQEDFEVSDDSSKLRCLQQSQKRETSGIEYSSSFGEKKQLVKKQTAITSDRDDLISLDSSLQNMNNQIIFRRMQSAQQGFKQQSDLNNNTSNNKQQTQQQHNQESDAMIPTRKTEDNLGMSSPSSLIQTTQQGLATQANLPILFHAAQLSPQELKTSAAFFQKQSLSSISSWNSRPIPCHDGDDSSKLLSHQRGAQRSKTEFKRGGIGSAQSALTMISSTVRQKLHGFESPSEQKLKQFPYLGAAAASVTTPSFIVHTKCPRCNQPLPNNTNNILGQKALVESSFATMIETQQQQQQHQQNQQQLSEQQQQQHLQQFQQQNQVQPQQQNQMQRQVSSENSKMYSSMSNYSTSSFSKQAQRNSMHQQQQQQAAPVVLPQELSPATNEILLQQKFTQKIYENLECGVLLLDNNLKIIHCTTQMYDFFHKPEINDLLLDSLLVLSVSTDSIKALSNAVIEARAKSTSLSSQLNAQNRTLPPDTESDFKFISQLSEKSVKSKPIKARNLLESLVGLLKKYKVKQKFVLEIQQVVYKSNLPIQSVVVPASTTAGNQPIASTAVLQPPAAAAVDAFTSIETALNPSQSMAIQLKLIVVYSLVTDTYETMVVFTNTREHDAWLKRDVWGSVSERISESVSHEFGTYMNIITSVTENGLDDHDIPMKAKKDYFRIIHTNSLLIDNLLNDMRDYFALSKQKLQLRINRINVKETVFQILELFKKQLQLKRLKTTIQIQKDIQNFVVNDQQLIKQILSNLLSNSLKFTLAGSIRIVIKMHTNKYIRLQVEDTGIGMTNEETDRLTCMLRNGFTDEKISKNSVGLGFGLLVSNKLARLIGDSSKNQAITFSSKHKEGSHFSFLIAISAAEAQSQLLQHSAFPSDFAAFSQNSARQVRFQTNSNSNSNSNNTNNYTNTPNNQDELESQENFLISDFNPPKKKPPQTLLPPLSSRQPSQISSAAYLLQYSRSMNSKQPTLPPAEESSLNSGDGIFTQLRKLPSSASQNQLAMEHSSIITSKINEVKSKVRHTITNKTPFIPPRTLDARNESFSSRSIVPYTGTIINNNNPSPTPSTPFQQVNNPLQQLKRTTSNNHINFGSSPLIPANSSVSILKNNLTTSIHTKQPQPMFNIPPNAVSAGTATNSNQIIQTNQNIGDNKNGQQISTNMTQILLQQQQSQLQSIGLQGKPSVILHRPTDLQSNDQIAIQEDPFEDEDIRMIHKKGKAVSINYYKFQEVSINRELTEQSAKPSLMTTSPEFSEYEFNEEASLDDIGQSPGQKNLKTNQQQHITTTTAAAATAAQMNFSSTKPSSQVPSPSMQIKQSQQTTISPAFLTELSTDAAGKRLQLPLRIQSKLEFLEDSMLDVVQQKPINQTTGIPNYQQNITVTELASPHSYSTKSVHLSTKLQSIQGDVQFPKCESLIGNSEKNQSQSSSSSSDETQSENENNNQMKDQLGSSINRMGGGAGAAGVHSSLKVPIGQAIRNKKGSTSTQLSDVRFPPSKQSNHAQQQQLSGSVVYGNSPPQIIVQQSQLQMNNINEAISTITMSMRNMDEKEKSDEECVRIMRLNQCTLEQLQNEQRCKKVLIVDDEIFNIYSVKLILSNLGLKDHICEAYNGEQAIELILKYKEMKSKRNGYQGYEFGLIIMDVNMPIMNGIECAKAIRDMQAENKLSYAPRIIAYTAFSDLETRMNCLEAGMDDILLKPSRRDNFISIIETYYLEQSIQ